MIAQTVALGTLAAAGVVTHRIFRGLKARGLTQCIAPLLRDSLRPFPRGPIDVLICIADHFEPRWGNPSDDLARQRVERWVTQYPSLFGDLRDSDGRPPRHSFFFPIDQYDAHHVDQLAALCRDGFGEVEIHLHHDADTADNLRMTLNRFTTLFAERHGLLSRNRNGQLTYGFIHGNWALDNARPDGRWCGVNNELDVLRDTGCYADFTLPSAPSPTQTRTINQIYYAVDDPCCAKSHDRGVRVGEAVKPERSLMMIQGPLLLDWRRRTLENACLQHSQPPSIARLDHWIRAGVCVPTRPDWFFVKLHTHGAPEANQRILLGEAMQTFHRDLANRGRQDRRFRYHYVTAREMYNLARAAEAGFTGKVYEALDFELRSNLVPAASRSAA